MKTKLEILSVFLIIVNVAIGAEWDYEGINIIN